MADMESAYLEREQLDSADLRDEYLQHFLRAEPVPGIAYEARMAKSLLPDISAEEVTAFAERLRPSNSCVIKTVISDNMR